MQHLVMMAALSFRAHRSVQRNQGLFGGATRGLSRAVMAYLDRRRRAIDAR